MSAFDFDALMAEFHSSVVMADDAYTLSLELAYILRAFNDSDDPPHWAFGLSGISDRASLRADEAASSLRKLGALLRALAPPSWSAGGGVPAREGVQGGAAPGGRGDAVLTLGSALGAGGTPQPCAACVARANIKSEGAAISQAAATVIISA